MAEMKDRAGNTLLTPITFDADLHDIEQMPEKTCHAASKQDAKPVFAMEATEIYHLSIYSELKAPRPHRKSPQPPSSSGPSGRRASRRPTPTRPAPQI